MNASLPAADLPFSRPFNNFAPPIAIQTPLRQAITSLCRKPETELLPGLLAGASLPAATRAAVAATAGKLIEALRAKPRGGTVEGLVQEYALSSDEGVALMCLAEALLRIPDTETRDALIRDKIADGDWLAHLGGDRPLFVNAATWGLAITGKLTSTVNDRGLAAALTRLIARCGEPVIRRGVDMAMRLMGEQFVTGETIAEALKRARTMEKKGFRYSYDMLGEAATTAADAARYYRDYETAIHAIGSAAAGRGVYEGPGISIKLSALHPRYSRAQAARVMAELLPSVKSLALIARSYDIGLNIDAEEADRLELSLDLLEALCLDPDLAGWNGMGFVVQAYGKRCPAVIDFVIDLARRAGRRIMVRLVKGAYWDAEIKRAQVDGLDGFPVFTRKVYTDVSYIACAARLLAAEDAVFPQFATHNAQTLATIYHMAGENFYPGKYEFQCLHGMGEPLYEEVVGPGKLDRPARIYAPVGTHETLLAYLVRRLLENGANSSFVNRIADPKVSIADLVTDPASAAAALPVVGAQHDRIALPADILAPRRNSSGFDLASEAVLASLSNAFRASVDQGWTAGPVTVAGHGNGVGRPVVNPGDHRDVIGSVVEASVDEARRAVADAAVGAVAWSAIPPASRAAMLETAADALEAGAPPLLALIMREAGKSLPNAVAEIREAVDFLRYYAGEARASLGPVHRPLGPVVCISPWNFPLAIFTGQIAAALVAGNPVLAKPAEETPLIAAAMVDILHKAGIPLAALQLLPGDGRIGAALVDAPDVAAVMFTGSTEVAKLIQRSLAARPSPAGKPIPLIAETGGQNAMIVDSSALAEQVVADVLASAFDSAGQRCSALRVLCLQDDIADRVLAMLKGAAAELVIGRTDRLWVDVGPVISAEASATIEAHVARMAASGCKVERLELPGAAAHGTFVAPTIIEIDRLDQLEREVFGPVLHVLRYRRRDMDKLIDAINATGYGLTFGLHTRLDETIAHVSARVRAGNLYINRNIIGAVVGVQPFGGRGLSGTGPKAGGPLYIGRLVERAPTPAGLAAAPVPPAFSDFIGWLAERGDSVSADAMRRLADNSAFGLELQLPGPVGEANSYRLHPRGTILLAPESERGLLVQLAAVLATGNRAVIDRRSASEDLLPGLPSTVAAHISWSVNWEDCGPYAGALIEGDRERVAGLATRIAELPGPLVLTQAASGAEIEANIDSYCLNWLLEEQSISVNTTAAGGNASLMTIG